MYEVVDKKTRHIPVSRSRDIRVFLLAALAPTTFLDDFVIKKITRKKSRHIFCMNSTKLCKLIKNICNFCYKFLTVCIK
jgi:hypothetical protein